jgi:hypothetical protein
MNTGTHVSMRMSQRAYINANVSTRMLQQVFVFSLRELLKTDDGGLQEAKGEGVSKVIYSSCRIEYLKSISDRYPNKTGLKILLRHPFLLCGPTWA